jgi:Zn-dependent peptidase ImmA (M78 family)/transcriptional regulator with XRE-family HTH domain
MYAEIKPALFIWACKRSGKSFESLLKKFPKLSVWMEGNENPTLKQLEKFAKSTYTPVGYFFLEKPPVEKLPLPDFRTIGNEYVSNPSPHLLDTIYLCQQRQEWYRDYLKMNGMKPRSFPRSVQTTDNIIKTAYKIRTELGFDIEKRNKFPTWKASLSHFIELVEKSGILVMRSGVYLNNNYRHLDVEEFRGFSISDDYAPLIFINGADTKAAQMFTLAHELVHIWLGKSGVTDATPALFSENKTEKWCNSVAAEILVPYDIIKNEYDQNSTLNKELNRLAKYFKVSTLVILRRIFDTGIISQNQFRNEYKKELDRLKSLSKKSGGGDFYVNQKYKVSSNFARALLISTLEGHTLHRDAFKLLGFSKLSTFRELGARLGVM